MVSQNRCDSGAASIYQCQTGAIAHFPIQQLASDAVQISLLQYCTDNIFHYIYTSFLVMSKNFKKCKPSQK